MYKLQVLNSLNAMSLEQSGGEFKSWEWFKKPD